MHYLLDMDGVIANFVDAAIKAHGQYCEHDDITQWDIADLWGITDSRFWEVINPETSKPFSQNPTLWNLHSSRVGRCIRFWSEIKPYEWMDTVIESISRSTWSICTSPSKSPYSTSGKVEWLQFHFGRDFRDFVITSQKHLLAGPSKCLIDDSDKNVELFREHGGQAILFPQPWNANRDKIGDRMGYLNGQLDLISGKVAS